MGRAIDVLGDRWTLLILRNATMGVTRFMRVIHLACGGDLAHDGHCAACERAVERAEIAWVRPWRSADPLPLADPA